MSTDCGDTCEIEHGGLWVVRWTDGLCFEVSLLVTDHPRPTVAHIRVDGELDAATAPVFRAALDTMIADGATDVYVDLQSLSLCSAAGLAVLEAACEEMHDRGGVCRLTNVTGVMAEVLEIGGLPFARVDGAADRTDPSRSPSGSGGDEATAVG